LVDGGFRRGTDVCKALALGADASASPSLPVGLGGVRRAGRGEVLELLRTEFRAAMMQCGVQTVKGFTPDFREKGLIHEESIALLLFAASASPARRRPKSC